jgi:hypothetical protein
MLPIFTRDNRGLAIVQFSRRPEKVFMNPELTIASSLVNRFRAYSDFFFLNVPSLCASVEAVHSEKTSFVMMHLLRRGCGSSATTAGKSGRSNLTDSALWLRLTAQGCRRL